MLKLRDYLFPAERRVAGVSRPVSPPIQQSDLAEATSPAS